MRGSWIRASVVLILVLAAGCDEGSSKPSAKPGAPDVGQKSVDQMRGMTGVAPPEGLQ